MDEKVAAPEVPKAAAAPPPVADAPPSGNRKVVRLLRSFAPAGALVMVGGATYVVSDVGTIEVDANLSDDALAKELGLAYVKA